jgi:hypothetical protein
MDEKLMRIMMSGQAPSESSQGGPNLPLVGGGLSSELDDTDVSLVEDLPLFSPTPSERGAAGRSVDASGDDSGIFPRPSDASTSTALTVAASSSAKSARYTSDFNIFRLVKLIRKPSMSSSIVQVCVCVCVRQ